jgi:hypothetical protein
MDFGKFVELARALDQGRVDYVLVGGVALALHGLVRATEDIDLFVRPGEDDVERLRRALRPVWDDADIAQITTADLAGQYPTVRYGPPGEDFVIDFISPLGSMLSFDDIEADIVTLGDIPVRVAKPATLYKMKRDTARPIDRADAVALRQKFGVGND